MDWGHRKKNHFSACNRDIFHPYQFNMLPRGSLLVLNLVIVQLYARRFFSEYPAQMPGSTIPNGVLLSPPVYSFVACKF